LFGIPSNLPGTDEILETPFSMAWVGEPNEIVVAIAASMFDKLCSPKSADLTSILPSGVLIIASIPSSVIFEDTACIVAVLLLME